jgi:membrane protease YdiL (CAAX protease family)
MQPETSRADVNANNWRRPGMVALSILLVLLPLPLVLLLAVWTGSDAVALAAVPLGVLLACLALRRRGSKWAEVGMKRLTPRAVAVGLIATLVLLPLTSVLSGILAELTGLEPDISKFDPLRGNVAMFVSLLFVAWTVAAFGEELLFRGFLMHSLVDASPGGERPRMKWGLALVLSSIVFGLGHAYQGAAGMILTGIIGLGFGLAYFAARRNLWGPILAHGLYDTVGFLFVFMSWDKLVDPSHAMLV